MQNSYSRARKIITSAANDNTVPVRVWLRWVAGTTIVIGLFVGLWMLFS